MLSVNLWLYKGQKQSKILSNSISEGPIFQSFLGGHAPGPPGMGMLRMPCVLRTRSASALWGMSAAYVGPGIMGGLVWLRHCCTHVS